MGTTNSPYDPKRMESQHARSMRLRRRGAPTSVQRTRSRVPTSRLAQIAADEQQALILQTLHEAGGVVSYGRLKEIGVEYPASVVSELELSGLPVEQCCIDASSAPRVMGVRFYPGYLAACGESGEPGIELMPEAYAFTHERARRGARLRRAADVLQAALDRAGALLARSCELALVTLRAGYRALARVAARLLDSALADPHRARAARLALRARAWRNENLVGAPRAPHRAVSPYRRWLAPALLLAIAGALAALAIGDLGGSGTNSRTTVAARHRAMHAAALARSRARRHPPPAHVAASVPVSPALAQQLEARGHALLEAGATAAAVPVLQEALAATGKRLNDCLAPASETCLSYAYALYDLGRALLLGHEPAAAVLVLERRLQIANQQPAVESELALARAQAGQRASGTPTSG